VDLVLGEALSGALNTDLSQGLAVSGGAVALDLECTGDSYDDGGRESFVH